MRTVLLLLALNLIFGLLALRMLGVPMTSSKKRPKPTERHLYGRHSVGAPGSASGPRPTRHAVARSFRPVPESASGKAAPIKEWSVSARRSTSKGEAFSKLLLSIIAYGASMAIFTVLVLRWIGAFLQQASS